MLTDSQRVPARDRRQRFVAALPLITLGLGLAVVAAVVLSERPMTPARLRGLVHNTFAPEHIGDTLVTFNVPFFSPFAPDAPQRAWLVTLGFVVVYLCSTIAIGSRVAAAIQGDDEWPRPVRLLAGFLPGYVMMLAPLQLLFAGVPYRTASWIAVVAAPVCAILLHRRTLLAAARNARLGWPGRGSGAWTVAIALGLVVVAAVHRLQQGVFFLTQDSIGYFLRGDALVLDGQFGHYLAHWNTQTDEWLYNAPLAFVDHGTYGDLWFPYYMTQSVSVAAFLCLVYGVVHRLARRRKTLAASVSVAVMFGSTLAIYPWLYVLIVGGGQPVIALAHPGRHVSIIAPWAALLLMRNTRRAGLGAIALLTLGLGMVTANAVLSVGAAVLAGLIWQGLPGRSAVLRRRASRAAVHGTVVAAMALPVAAFAFTRGAMTSSTLPVALLLLAVAVALAGALVISRATTTGHAVDRGRRQPAWFSAWVLTAACGVLISDNVGAGGLGKRVHDLLAQVFAGYRPPVLQRSALDAPLSGLSFPTFSHVACDANVACGGIPYFLVAYGVLFTLVLSAWVGYGRLDPEAHRANQRRVAALVALAVLPLGLIAVFFTGLDALQAGALSRVLEWPYYTLLVLGVLGFCESRHRRVVIVGVGFLAIWTIVPLLGIQWPVQMVRNAGWYLDRFGVL
jgi:hypothetical protein